MGLTCVPADSNKNFETYDNAEKKGPARFTAMVSKFIIGKVASPNCGGRVNNLDSNWSFIVKAVLCSKQQLKKNKNKKKNGSAKKAAVVSPSKEGKKKKKKRKRKVVTDPGMPKRGKSGYLFYCEATRPIITEQFPKLPPQSIISKMGEGWRGLTPEQKKPFDDLAAKDKATQAALIVKYKASPAHQAWLEKQQALVSIAADDSSE